MNNQIWEFFFFFRDILFFSDKGKIKQHRLKPILSAGYFFDVSWFKSQALSYPFYGPGRHGFIPYIHHGFWVGSWVQMVQFAGNFPTTKSKQISKFERCTWDPLGGRVLGLGSACCMLLWPLVVTTCCVFRNTEHCDIMSMFMNMHGLVQDMVNTIVLSWSWGFTTSVCPVRIENMLGTFCLPISPHLDRICTPLYITMGLFIKFYKAII